MSWIRTFMPGKRVGEGTLQSRDYFFSCIYFHELQEFLYYYLEIVRPLIHSQILRWQPKTLKFVYNTEIVLPNSQKIILDIKAKESWASETNESKNILVRKSIGIPCLQFPWGNRNVKSLHRFLVNKFVGKLFLTKLFFSQFSDFLSHWKTQVRFKTQTLYVM